MSDVASLFKELEARITGTTKNRRKSFNLLYRTRGTVSADDFHLCCDGKGPTITLLYGKYNTLFGGYTSKNWSSDKKKLKSDKHAFLFYKNDNAEAICHFLPVKETHQDRAITCDANFGPTFGGGPLAWNDYDLQTFVSDKKHKSENIDNYLHLNGTINIKHAYERETAEPVQRSTYSRMSHAYNELLKETGTQDEQSEADINGGKLIVKLLEVYQVIDDYLDVPWRHKPKDEGVEEMKKKLENMELLPGLGLEDYNILLIGIIGAGKSSFFNTLATVFAKDVKSHAIVGEESESVTNEVHAYKLATDTGKQLKLRIFDIRGFEDNRGYRHELDLLLEGRLPDDYTFPELSTPLKPEEIKIENRQLKDEIHLVCFVVDATKLDVLSDDVHTIIAETKRIIRRKGTPMVSVATKFDNLCPKIAEDADHVYNSPKARASTKAVSACFGIPFKHVFPIVNYVDETEPSKGKNRLAIQALSSMVQLTEDYLKHHKGMATKCDSWTTRSQHLPLARNANEKDVVLKELLYEMSEIEGKKLRVLVIGAISSGKSSFIDSVSTALREHIVNRAAGELLASGVPEGDSSTERFQMHPMKYKHESGRLKSSNVYFGDTPGFQEVGGITVEHVKYILKGHVRNKYKIINGIEKDSKGFIPHPRRPDKIHCVCFVFDCKAMVDGISDTLKTKLKNAIHVVSEEEIPYIAILTKCDENNEAVMEDKRRVFTSKIVTECKDKVMDIFKFKQNLIFPVVNYVNESTVDLQIDVLLIAAFSEILKKGKEYLEDNDDEEDDEDFEERTPRSLLSR